MKVLKMKIRYWKYEDAEKEKKKKKNPENTCKGDKVNQFRW